MLIGFYLEAVAVMACGRWRLATHSQQIVGGFSVGATPSRARPRDALRCLSAPAELAVTSLLTARSTFGAGGDAAPFFSPTLSFLFLFSFFLSFPLFIPPPPAFICFVLSCCGTIQGDNKPLHIHLVDKQTSNSLNLTIMHQISVSLCVGLFLCPQTPPISSRVEQPILAHRFILRP